MMIGAGPSGGGKSSIFPIFQMQIDAFRADLRAATVLGEAMGARKPVFQPASGDEEHFHAEPIQMGSAGLIDRM